MSFINFINQFQSLYENEKTSIVGGYYLKNSDSKSNLDNYIVKGKKVLSTAGGLSNNDIFFLYGICELLKPKNILIIGNAYGVSTIALRLMCPNSKVISIDKYRTKGIKFTNSLLSKICKKSKAIKASSPDNLEEIANIYFKNKMDLVFCDGFHSNKMINSEFNALKNYINTKGFFVFHDILSCGMYKGFLKIRKNNNFKHFLVTKSNVGLGLSFNKKIFAGSFRKKISNYLSFYCHQMSTINNFKLLLNSPKSKKFFFFPPHPQL